MQWLGVLMLHLVFVNPNSCFCPKQNFQCVCFISFRTKSLELSNGAQQSLEYQNMKVAQLGNWNRVCELNMKRCSAPKGCQHTKIYFVGGVTCCAIGAWFRVYFIILKKIIIKIVIKRMGKQRRDFFINISINFFQFFPISF